MGIQRKYKSSDGALLEFAAKTQGHFSKYHAAFTKLDPVLTEEWLAGFVTAAKDTTLDSFERSTMVQQTEDLHKLIDRFHAHFGLVEYYISVAFESNPSHMRHFDLDSYTDARRIQSDLVKWCRKFGQRIAEHKEALLAVGATEEVLTEVQQLAKQIDETNDAQEMSKDLRAAQTQERVIVLNKLYKALQRVEKVAGFVFPLQSAQYGFFKLPVYRAPAQERGEEEGSAGDHDETPPSAEE